MCLHCPGQPYPMFTLLKDSPAKVFMKDHCWRGRLQVILLVGFETGRLAHHVLSAVSSTVVSLVLAVTIDAWRPRISHSD